MERAHSLLCSFIFALVCKNVELLLLRLHAKVQWLGTYSSRWVSKLWYESVISISFHVRCIETTRSLFVHNSIGQWKNLHKRQFFSLVETVFSYPDIKYRKWPKCDIQTAALRMKVWCFYSRTSVCYFARAAMLPFHFFNIIAYQCSAVKTVTLLMYLKTFKHS